MSNPTEFDVVCEILGEIFVSYKDDARFIDTLEFADLGFPLAYSIANGIVESTSIAKEFILDAWDIILKENNLEEEEFFSPADFFEVLDEINPPIDKSESST